MRRVYTIIILTCLIASSWIAYPYLCEGKSKKEPLKVKLDSEPQGAKVYMNGVLVCESTPAVISISNRDQYIYTKEKNRVNNTSIPPWQIKFTFVKEGYERITEIYEGGYFDVSRDWYLIKPKGLGVTAFLKKDNSTDNSTTSKVTNKREDFNPLIRWFFESSQNNCRLFWRIISTVPDEVASSSDIYLGTAPYDETKNIKIAGLTENNANKIQIEVKATCNGYRTTSKRFNLGDVINLQEISWYFDLTPNNTKE